jgi:hypothetical protein
MDHLTVLCFTENIAIHAWKFVYDLSAVGSSYQLHWPLFSVKISEQFVTSWSGIL